MSSFEGRILVIRGGAIGDFILTLPAIAALRRQFPTAHLEVLGYPHIAQLALAGGLVNRVQSIEARALAGFFARGGDLSEDLAAYFSEFDLILSYLYDPDGVFQTNVSLCTAAQFIAGPHRADEAVRLHATRVYLQPLERLAIFDADPIPRLALAARPSSINYQLSDINLLALHPGSGSERKNWPEAKWGELLGHLLNSTELQLAARGRRSGRRAATAPGRRAAAGPLPGGAKPAAGGPGAPAGTLPRVYRPRFGHFASCRRGGAAGRGPVGGHGGRNLAAPE